MNKLLILFSLIFAISCSNTKYENYISADIDGETTIIPQYNMENVNTSNTYFPDYKNLWMQAAIYPDSSYTAEQKLNITIYKLDIDSIDLPYKLNANKGENALVSWWNKETIDALGNKCSGVDNGCTFMGSLKNGDIEMEILRINGNNIEGKFSGSLFLKSTGFSMFQDTSEIHTIENGNFKIKFRRDK